MTRRSHVLRTLAAIAALLVLPGAAAADDFYAGKQITFIVGAGVGGGYDMQARTVARHLPRFIPGNPTIIVQNMPSRIGATNHMFNTAPADGTTIALVQRNMLLAKLTHPETVRFDIAKFNWIGSLNSETAVTLAWHTAPHRTAKDLFDQELIVGGITSVDPETTPKLYNVLIGTRFRSSPVTTAPRRSRSPWSAARCTVSATGRGRASRRCGRSGWPRRRSRS